MNKMETENEEVTTALSHTLASTQISSSIIPVSTSLPTTLSRSYKLLGIHTDAYVQIFQDRIVVGVSQRQQRIGTWCLCQASQSAVDPKAIDFNINVVLGDRSDAMAGVYARQITEQIIRGRFLPGTTTMVVFLGIALQDHGNDPEMFQTVLQVLLQLIQDALTLMK